MRLNYCVSLLMLVYLCGTTSVWAAAAEQHQNVDKAQVQHLEEKMLNNSEIMALIMALQEDPEMKSLLNDQDVLNAVQSGDINALTKMPRFMQLLNNPRIRDIEKRLTQ